MCKWETKMHECKRRVCNVIAVCGKLLQLLRKPMCSDIDLSECSRGVNACWYPNSTSGQKPGQRPNYTVDAISSTGKEAWLPFPDQALSWVRLVLRSMTIS